MFVIAYSVGTFAFRSGVPGMRHDWVWPGEPAGFVRWFVDTGISQWNPNGLGNAGQISTFNLVLAPLALMGLAGVPSSIVLFVLVAGSLVGAFYGMLALFRALAIPLETTASRALGLCYALGPVAFQKAVAGHLYWLAAYAALPWFVTHVWTGVRRDGDWRAFGAAALLYALSTTQIQFAVFDAIAMILIAVVLGARRRAWTGLMLILAVGLVHNLNAIRGPFGPPDTFDLARSHATLAWERDMSTPFFDAARYAGYVGYDRIALPGMLHAIFETVAVLGCLGAVAGLVVARDRRAVAFGSLGVLTLVFVSGLYGPLAGAFSWSVVHVGAFTIFRELYHAMALYALSSTVLLALAIVSLRRAGTPIALAVAATLSAPFWTGGLARLIPAVALEASEHERDPFHSRLQVLLPYQQPLSAPGLGSGGIDPARFVGDDAATGLSLALRAALDPSIDSSSQKTLLADAGVAHISWRPHRFSTLASSFEPGVGASYGGFAVRQRDLLVRYAKGVVIDSARTALELEDPKNVDPLATFVADDRLPPGRRVPFDSSYIGNGIRENWVSGELWSWFAPELTNVIGEPVMTESSAPLVLHANANAGDTVYVLAAATDARFDGRPVAAISPWQDGRYRWYAQREETARADIGFSAVGLSSVARCIVSTVGSWHPPLRRIRSTAPTVLPYRQTVPWHAETMIPRTAVPMRLVFARTYASAWHLRLAGVDVGQGQRFDGIFTSWLLPPTSVPLRAELSYVPQSTSGALVALDVVIEITLFGLLMRSFVLARGRRCA